MVAHSRQLEVYETPSGSCPFDEWLDNLRDAKARARIEVRLDRLEQGNFGDCEPVGEGVHELKMDFGPGYRAYFAEKTSTIVLLLLGGDKSTQNRDIKTAKAYWRQYRKSG